jgi:hypothetical protein
VLRGEGSSPTLFPMQRGGTLAKEATLSQGREARQLHKVRVGSTHLVAPGDPFDLSRGGMGVPFFWVGTLG